MKDKGKQQVRLGGDGDRTTCEVAMPVEHGVYKTASLPPQLGRYGGAG